MLLTNADTCQRYVRILFRVGFVATTSSAHSIYRQIVNNLAIKLLVLVQIHQHGLVRVA